MLSETDTWDVAVVGAGPTGLLLSAELAAKKVGVVVLERAEVASSIPKANGIVGHAAVELAKRGIKGQASALYPRPDSSLARSYSNSGSDHGVHCTSCPLRTRGSLPNQHP